MEALRKEALKRVGPGVCWICEAEPLVQPKHGKRTHCPACQGTYDAMYWAEYGARRRRVERAAA